MQMVPENRTKEQSPIALWDWHVLDIKTPHKDIIRKEIKGQFYSST